MLATITRFLVLEVRSGFIQIQREAHSTEWAIAEGEGLLDFCGDENVLELVRMSAQF